MKFFYEKRRSELEIREGRSLAFNAHLHEHIELIYMRNGKARAVSDGIECRLEKGDVFMAFPNCVHYYDCCENDETVLVIVSPELMPEYKRVFSEKVPVSPAIRDDDGKIGELLMKTLSCTGPFKNEIAHGLLIAVFGILFEKMAFREQKNTAGGTIPAILKYCEENYKNELNLSDVAHQLHLSNSYISHIFGKKLNMNFRDYINSLRMNDALRLLLRSEKNMTQISNESGFETIRTFNRCFRKQFGKSPLEYRKSVLADGK